MGPRERYDAVIVGGGHNALVAAAYLARAGRSCLLLERRAELGGATTSCAAFAGVDARVSRYSYLVSLLPRSILDDLGVRVRLARRTIASYTPDPRADARRGLLVDERDAAATGASFAAVAGGREELGAWRELQAMVGRVARAVFPTMTEPLRTREQLRALVGDGAAWEALFERPLGHTLAGLLRDDLTRGLALTDALIGTFAAAEEPGLRQNRCFLYHVLGGDWRVPVGGMGALSDALARAARAGGAELLSGAEVTALDPARDSVGVRLVCDGRERVVRAQRALVGAAPAQLERLLGRESAPRGRAPEGSQVKLNLLLARLPRLREQTVTAERAFTGTFHVNETAGQLEDAYRRAAAGAMPEPVPCEAYCQTLTDASILSPRLRAEGVHAVGVFALHMPARLFASDPEGARAEALAAIMRSLNSVLAEPLEDCLLADANGRPCVEAHTPLDIERELCMPGGHIFHRDLAWPFAEHDHEAGSWGVETEHPAILLCGAGARRGGAVSGIAGHNAAMAALAA